MKSPEAEEIAEHRAYYAKAVLSIKHITHSKTTRMQHFDRLFVYTKNKNQEAVE
jgi:hypothetical protein